MALKAIIISVLAGSKRLRSSFSENPSISILSKAKSNTIADEHTRKKKKNASPFKHLGIICLHAGKKTPSIIKRQEGVHKRTPCFFA